MPQISPSYHHGDLRAALVEAGLELARSGGPAAVTVREVTRAAGVSPASAYRHFADHRALVVAVALAAQGRLATTMEARIDALVERAGVDTADAAVARLRGVGLGYIEFALAEPGWFALALLTFDPGGSSSSRVSVDAAVPPPFQLLIDALDGCVTAGVLSTEGRINAEWPCWSAVHGFADIATRGPLQGQDAPTLTALGTHVVDRIVAGVRSRSVTPQTDSPPPGE
ncbi:TetR/AcrR family transcriptional regulator [Demequina sp. NBRC 110055]|uniref:TetR/AcrR family transcriptional regulator n=1 Tax=Demequina sp. NBRC 110055 TaxID=1570344 RepID=UPI000A036563|nr:TetR/AcrR family transcriptional regulator [Demequina sp. NBRC 110055]